MSDAENETWRLNASPWKTLIPGCFSLDRAPFAAHPLDSERAVEMYLKARVQGASDKNVLSEIRKYLLAQNFEDEDDYIAAELKRAKSFIRGLHPVSKMKRAWLITWEGTEIGTEDREKKIIAIRDPRTSGEKIREFVEQFYIASEYGLSDKLYYSTRKKKNPYPAKFYANIGGQWRGRIDCGHNPHIYARLVDNLIVLNEGLKIHWDERAVGEILQRELD